MMGDLELYADIMSDSADDSDSDDTLDSLNGTTSSPRRRRASKPCKYVPHSEKPPHLVQKRNARERRRVQAVNSAFIKLRKVVPYENKHKRLSKVGRFFTCFATVVNFFKFLLEKDGLFNLKHSQLAVNCPINVLRLYSKFMDLGDACYVNLIL